MPLILTLLGLLVTALITALVAVRIQAARERERDKLHHVYAFVDELRETLVVTAALSDRSNDVRREFPRLTRRHLNRMCDDGLKYSAILASVLQADLQANYGALRFHFGHSPLQPADHDRVDAIFESEFGRRPRARWYMEGTRGVRRLLDYLAIRAKS